MKNQRKLQISIITILAAAATMVATAQPPGAAGKNGPPADLRNSQQLPGVDPATGLPLGAAVRSWKDPEWKDPDKKLTVSYEDLPLSEVAADLRKQFNDAFDIIVPRSTQLIGSDQAFDVPGLPIQIRLKDVRASEVFNALNLMFEAENTPLSWELRMNGSRPIALLRAWPNVIPAPIPAERPQRKVFFVGDLVTDEKGGMTMEQLVQTISEIYEMSHGGNHAPGADHLQFHKAAQLLVVTGTSDEIGFIHETIGALGQKIAHGSHVPRANSAPEVKTEPELKTDKPKSP